MEGVAMRTGITGLGIAVVGVLAAALLAATAEAKKPSTKDVLVVSNNWAGTADLVNPHSFRRMERINVIPDAEQRIAEIERDPVALVCVWRLVTMVRRGTVFSHAAFRYVDIVIGAIVAAALVWFTVAAINAPDQRDDPGVTLVMCGIGVAILGVALIVLVLRMLLAQAVAREVEATQLRAELNEVI
jgi:hypothetical protein